MAQIEFCSTTVKLNACERKHPGRPNQCALLPFSCVLRELCWENAGKVMLRTGQASRCCCLHPALLSCFVLFHFACFGQLDTN